MRILKIKARLYDFINQIEEFVTLKFPEFEDNAEKNSYNKVYDTMPDLKDIPLFKEFSYFGCNQIFNDYPAGFYYFDAPDQYMGLTEDVYKAAENSLGSELLIMEISFPNYSVMQNKKINIYSRNNNSDLYLKYIMGESVLMEVTLLTRCTPNDGRDKYLGTSLAGFPWFTADGLMSYACSFGCNLYYIRNNVPQSPPGKRGSVGSLGTISSQHFTYENFKTFFSLNPSESDPENPWDDNGYSEEDTGDSNFSEDSDDIDLDTLPSIDAVGTGFATLFTPTKPQLKSLADIMWSHGIFQALQNLVQNISGMFTSLAMVPFTVENAGNVTVMFLGLIDTTVTLRLASKQFYEFNMGSINLATDDRIYSSGTCLDYSPFSKLGIFLPFIGYQDLDIDECRGCVINLKYRIDILSGACVALISLNGNTVYQFSGNCLTQIPITNENMQSLVSDAINVGIAASNARSAVGAASADIGAAEKSAMSQPKKDAAIAHAEAHQTTAMNQLHSATANAAMGLKPTFGKAGAISAASSMLAVKQPYLFLTTPRANIPFHYQKYCGFPSNITGKLNEFSGYTVVEDIRLNGLVATAPEVAEIYSLLKSGVII